ncbi:DUF397 domain-containing protein [Streptomyces sp. TLI_105]|uniref:DUF397 domain-containing protein n=1 Tax=Streptomyces sp. TLI_105 TaxID=1881019 RepID=UPI00352645E7
MEVTAKGPLGPLRDPQGRSRPVAGGVPAPDRVGGGGPRTTHAYDLSNARRRKSSYSDGGGNRVEVLDDIPGVVPVRDSKSSTVPS